jgi:hypothetical protein
MDNPKETVNQSPKPRTSKLAKAAFIMGLLCIPLLPFFFLLTMICGIAGLIIIRRSKGKLKGAGYAITGIVIAILMLFIFMTTVVPGLVNAIRNIAQKQLCPTNLKGLGTAIIVYANDHNDLLPPADQWCDLLITEDDVSPKILFCPYSNAIEGESTYAININAAGKEAGIPGDMVLLFETDTGIDPNGRTETLQNRPFFHFFQKQGYNEFDSIKDNKVYPNRWNLSGGPEMLSTRCHDRKGCHVVFGDGHSSWVTAAEIPHLRWTADEPASKKSGDVK